MTLHIKGKWFNMILSGIKKEEYRAIKPYYEKRIFNEYRKTHAVSLDSFLLKLHNESINFNDVEFINGYSGSSPSFVAHCSLHIGRGNTEWGAEDGVEYFVFSVHEIKSTLNLI